MILNIYYIKKINVLRFFLLKLKKIFIFNFDKNKKR